MPAPGSKSVLVADMIVVDTKGGECGEITIECSACRRISSSISSKPNSLSLALLHMCSSSFRVETSIGYSCSSTSVFQKRVNTEIECMCAHIHIYNMAVMRHLKWIQLTIGGVI